MNASTESEPTNPAVVDADGVDRRGFLKCMAWAGTALSWTVAGGALASCGIGSTGASGSRKDLLFVQVSDSHIGFRGAANPDVTGTFTKAIAEINALPEPPAFVIHTGDLTHLSTPDQFDTVSQMLGTIRTSAIFPVAGEHDGVGDDGRLFLQTFGKNGRGLGYHSFDVNGVHFLALSNALRTQGLGHLGPDQLDFIKKDLAGLSSDTPLVVFSHIPLFAMYPQWGWATDDSIQALRLMRRFGSVTCLNGHVHQVFSVFEGNVAFHSGRGTGLVSARPGEAASPSPIVLPSDLLHNALGIREARYTVGQSVLAIKDDALPAG